ncbi:MAG: AAA family ATPase [Desulfobulbaceae bacterium]|jgi:general secretion pathway protein A|nr:AAA family ATPase [Desulfobulbaceae bacterium]
MYREFFGLQSKPFELTSDSRSLFLSETHRQGLATLKYGVVSNSGFLLLTGGVGTGKTTLINALVTELKDSHYLCLLSNPILEVADFYRYFAAKLGLRYDGVKSHFLLMLSQLLEKCLVTNRKVLLIIDEAHALPYDLFEEIRFLENVSSEQKNILSIFLVGQPELLGRLAEERLRAVRQRVGIRFHLEPLTSADVLAYINYRLMVAGRDTSLGDLFTDKAVEYIHRATGGVPRVINVVCDNAMLTAYSRGQRQIDHTIIQECVKQMYIPGDENVLEPIPEQSFWEKWLWPLIVCAAVLEILAVWLAVHCGLVDYIVGLFK